MSRNRKSFVRAALFAGLVFLVIGSSLTITKYAVGRQTSSQLVLTAIGPAMAVNPTSALISVPRSNGVYLVNRLSGEVDIRGDFHGDSVPAVKGQPYVDGPLSISPTGYAARVVEGSVILTQGPTGESLGRFSVSEIVSLAVMSNGNVVVAAPINEQVLHIYSSTGQSLSDFADIQIHNRSGRQRTIFMHKGKVLVGADDSIYYVFRHVPRIQKYSPSGELQFDMKVSGDAINIQQEVADKALRNNNAVGVDIITSAAIDYETNHLWISMNGSSTTGIVYEHSADGEKIREFALEYLSPSGSTKRITGIRDIAISNSRLHIITQDHNVYSFKTEEWRVHTASRQIGRSNRNALSGFNATFLASFLGNKTSSRNLDEEPPCGVTQPWGTCEATCNPKGCQTVGTRPNQNCQPTKSDHATLVQRDQPQRVAEERRERSRQVFPLRTSAHSAVGCTNLCCSDLAQVVLGERSTVKRFFLKMVRNIV